MQRFVRTTLWAGVSMFALGIFSYAFLFLTYELVKEAYPKIYLILLCLILIGYAGIPVSLASAFLFSLTAETKAKLIIWAFIALVLSMFIPIPYFCRSAFDERVCDARLLALLWSDNADKVEIRWESLGYDLVFEEGIGDVWKEVKEVTTPKPVLHECYSNPEKCPFTKNDLLRAVDENGFGSATAGEITMDHRDKYGRWIWRFFRQVPDTQCFRSGKRAEALIMDPITGETSELVNRCVQITYHL